jgi:uncharacterized membrane protein
MSATEHQPGKHPKHDFQVERLAFFSDAVFAIAITLLVIEFKVPHVDSHTTYEEAMTALKGERLKFFALLFSFLLIATYWIRHHILFKYIHSYNRTVLVANIMVLMPMIFFPFTTAFFYESAANSQVLPIAFRLFAVNNILGGVFIYYLFWLVTKKHPEMSYPMESDDREIFVFRVLWMVGAFALVVAISFIDFEKAYFGMIPLAVVLFYQRFRRKNKNKRAA